MGFPYRELSSSAGGCLSGKAASASTLEVSRQRPDDSHLSGMLRKDSQRRDCMTHLEGPPSLTDALWVTFKAQLEKDISGGLLFWKWVLSSP